VSLGEGLVVAEGEEEPEILAELEPLPDADAEAEPLPDTEGDRVPDKLPDADPEGLLQAVADTDVDAERLLLSVTVGQWLED
jgi:hypothetical protein